MKMTFKVYSKPKLEHHLAQQDKNHKKLARKLAKHCASKNLPRATGDALAPYIGQLKAGYEADAIEIHKVIQPKTLAPSLKFDIEHKNDRDQTLLGKIDKKNAENQNDTFELDDFNPSSVDVRIFWVLLLSIILLAGETAWNTISFQITGTNLLFSMFLSFILSLAVFIFAHLIPIYYKELLSKISKWILLIGSTFSVIIVFYIVAVFRSKYLARSGNDFSVVYFILINLFIYEASMLLSFRFMPEWDEIVEHWHHMRRLKSIKKKSKEIIKHNKERQKLRDEACQDSIIAMKIADYAKGLLELTKRRYMEAVEIFKSTNQSYRTDKVTPDCFNDQTPSPDIDDSQIPLIK